MSANLPERACPSAYRDSIATVWRGGAILRHLLVGPVTVTPVLDEGGRVEGWEFLGTGWARSGARRAGTRNVAKANTTEVVPPEGGARSLTLPFEGAVLSSMTP